MPAGMSGGGRPDVTLLTYRLRPAANAEGEASRHGGVNPRQCHTRCYFCPAPLRPWKIPHFLKLHAWPPFEDISGCSCAERPRWRRREYARGSRRYVPAFARWQLAKPAELRVCARDRISSKIHWPLELKQSCALRFRYILTPKEP